MSYKPLAPNSFNQFADEPQNHAINEPGEVEDSTVVNQVPDSSSEAPKVSNLNLVVYGLFVKYNFSFVFNCEFVGSDYINICRNVYNCESDPCLRTLSVSVRNGEIRTDSKSIFNVIHHGDWIYDCNFHGRSHSHGKYQTLQTKTGKAVQLTRR